MGIQSADSVGRRLKQCSIFICCCQALAHQRYVFGRPTVKSRHKHSFSKGPLPLHMRCRVTESVLNEILGLQNKPKAAVHLEHKPMGPKKKKKKSLGPSSTAHDFRRVISPSRKFYSSRTISCTTNMPNISNRNSASVNIVTDWGMFCREIMLVFMEDCSEKTVGPNKTVEIDEEVWSAKV